MATVMAPAIDAFRKARRRVLALYPTVADTLAALKAKGVRIAAFTESKAFYTNYRFRKLGLDGLVDVLYSPEDHSVPAETVLSVVGTFGADGCAEKRRSGLVWG